MIPSVNLLAVKFSRLAGAPRLMTAYLRRSNRTAAQRLMPPILVGLGGVLAFVLLYAQRDWVEEGVNWLRHQILAATGLAIVASAVAIARRRVSKRAEFARSWLAALPVRARVANWEKLFIETLPALAAVAALTGAYIAVAALTAFAAGRGGGSALAVWAAMSGGVMLGAILSYGLPGPRPVDLAPGSRYVPHRRAAQASAVRPSFKALGVWPLRLVFARAQPKLVARSLLPVLLLMLMGTSAAAAMVIIAFYVVAGALLLLIPAAISVGSKVRGWVAPLPARASSVMQAVLVPTLAAIGGASTAEGLFLFLMGVSQRTAAVTALCMAVVACLVTTCGSIVAQAGVRPSVRNQP